MMKCPGSVLALVLIPRQPYTSSEGPQRNITILPEQIEVLRSTETLWKAIVNCLGVSPGTLSRRSMDYAIADSCSITTE